MSTTIWFEKCTWSNLKGNGRITATQRFTKGLFINQTFKFSSYFFEQISFGFKLLQRSAHVHNIYHLYLAIMKTGRVFFSILKLLIQLIARSTWIRRLVTSLVFLNFCRSHLTSHLSTWWNFKTTEMNE